jgi:hypothetical protein
MTRPRERLDARRDESTDRLTPVGPDPWPVTHSVHPEWIMSPATGSRVEMSCPSQVPLPLSNTLPAYGVLFLALGSVERDGYVVLVGYLMVLLTVGYFSAVGIMGGLGASALRSYL